MTYDSAVDSSTIRLVEERVESDVLRLNADWMITTTRSLASSLGR